MFQEAHHQQSLASSGSQKGGGGMPWLKLVIGLGAVAAVSVAGFRYYKAQHS